MSNQKITELRSLTSTTIDDADLFTVVDVSSNASPTGETKNISTIQLVNRMVASSVDQINQTLENTSPLHHSHSIDDIIDLRSRLNSFISSSQIGQSNGIVPLGSNTKINSIYLPDSISGSNFVRTIFGRTGNVTASAGDYSTFYITIDQKGVANGIAALDGVAKVNIANLPSGTPLGVASLDAFGKVPLTQLPDTTTGSFPVTAFNSRTGAVIPISSDYSTFYVSQSGGTLTGPLNVLVTPTAPSHSVSKAYVDSVTGSFLPITGGTMTGQINVLITPTAPSHSVSKAYVDSVASAANFGVRKLSEKSVGGGRQSYAGFPFIDKEDNARAIGNSINSKYGQVDAYPPASILPLPSFEKADKFYSNTYNSIILSKTGNVYGLGRNTWGELAISGIYNNNISIPTQASLPAVSKVIMSANNNAQSFMYLTTAGTLYSSGRNQYGQLGIGNTTDTNVAGPKLVLGPGNGYGNPTLTVTDAFGVGAAGAESYIALLSNGTVWTVGYGGHGQSGNGATVAINNLWKQVIVTGGGNLTNVSEINASGDNADASGDNAQTTFYARTADNKLYVWGYNGHGQIGDGTTVEKNRATLVDSSTIKFWCFAANGTAATFIKKTDNNIYAAGYNQWGQLGVGDVVNRSTFTICSALTGKNIENIFSGCNVNGAHTWAKETGNNKIYVCGYNNWGQHGTGDNNQRTSFTLVPFNSNSTISDISVESNVHTGAYTYILTTDGNIYHSGWSGFGYGGGNAGNYPRYFFAKTTNNVVG